MAYNLKPSYASVDELQTRDRAITILYGRQPDALGGNIVPIKVDADGNLSIGTNLMLSASDIDLGDIVMKGVTDPSLQGDVHTPGEERVGLIRVGDLSAPDVNLYEVLVRDPRFSFVGAALQTTAVGSGTVFPVEMGLAVTAATHTTFAPIGQTFNLKGLLERALYILNTGAADVDIRGVASIDDGVTFDIVVVAASTLSAGASALTSADIGGISAFTHFKWEAQRVAADTTVTIKGFGE